MWYSTHSVDNFEYTISQSSRSRTLRITVTRSGAVRVSAPKRASLTLIKNFVQKNSTWVHETLRKQKVRPLPLLATASRKDFLEAKKEAHKQIFNRLITLNLTYGFSWNNITVRMQKSRWGSCTSKKNLNFNYMIVRLPEKLCDYVIVHELCHLQEMNHGPRFWALVARTFPNYRELRKQLSTM